MSSLVEKSKLALLGLAVVLCKSLGSLIFAVLAVPLLWVGSRTMIAGTAFFLAIVVITFPITRSADVFPTEQVLDVARVIDPNRAESLKFRFSNEDTLLAHAAERPIWGWGPNGRNFAVSDAGSDAVFDGLWIIMIGSRGWLGFFATFFLLLYPIYLVWRLRAHPEVPFTAIGASLLLALNMVEWLPNSTIGPWTWLLAGSLTGYAVSVGKTSQQSPSKPIQGRTENRRRTVI